MVYVSMTGFRPKGMPQLPAFWWRTARSLKQARCAPGKLLVVARMVSGVYHTMSVWSDFSSMRRFVETGAHLKAMKNFRALGTGKIFGYECDQTPDWNIVYQLWTHLGRDV